MSWLNSREKKEKEKLDSEKAIKEKQESLHKLRSQLVNDLDEIINRIKIQDLGFEAFNHIRHLFDPSINSKKIIQLSLVDDNKISTLLTDSDSKKEWEWSPFSDLVECFYLFFSLLDTSQSVMRPRHSHNQYNKTIMALRHINTRLGLNANIYDKIEKGGFFEKSINFQTLRGIVKPWASKPDDINKMKSTLEELRNDKLITFYLWMKSGKPLDNKHPDLILLDIKGTPSYFDEIKENILKEKKKYNKRILKLFQSEDIEEVKKALMPNILNSYKILTESYNGTFVSKPALLPINIDLNDWNKISSNMICSLIVIDSISKIKSFNPYPDDFIDNTYCLDKPKRQISSVPKSYDHIWIDGVGWMHEDEIGHDR